MANVLPFPKFRAFDADGVPLDGGKLYSYIAGSNTPQSTFTDKTEATANANPVVLDANGEANVWLGNGLNYKLILTDSQDVVLWTVDNVAHHNDSSITLAMLSNGILANSTAGRLKMADGYLSNSADGLAKMAAGYLQATSDGLAKMAAGYLQASTDGLAKMAAGYFLANADGLAKFAAGLFTADANGRGKFADGIWTKAKLAALGQVESSGSSNFSTASTSYVDVTNLSVSLTTIGRPVLLLIVSDGSVLSNVGADGNGSTNGVGDYQILRDSTTVAQSKIGHLANNYILFPGSIVHFDTPSAGTYTYKMQLKAQSGATANMRYMKLVAFEL